MKTKLSASTGKRKKCKKFTKKEIRFIKQWTVDAPPGGRKSAKELALCVEMKRHTKESIATRIKNDGFADKTKSLRIQTWRLRGLRENGELLDFLRGQGRFWPTSVIVKRFGCYRNRIARLRKKHDLLLRHGEEALKDPVYSEWYKAREEHRIAKLRGAFQERPLQNQLALQERLEQFSATGNPGSFETKECRRCHRIWPWTPEFFRTNARFNKHQRYFVLISVCHACVVNKRRKKS